MSIFENAPFLPRRFVRVCLFVCWVECSGLQSEPVLAGTVRTGDGRARARTRSRSSLSVLVHCRVVGRDLAGSDGVAKGADRRSRSINDSNLFSLFTHRRF